ncbi:nuclear transport factor 2 family protein [Streptomyces europaeiscabiei]|uniref:nuclear transport factor 2 family protein n=1 Tax=Streptomyces europaeiscabiei TaxID=146819 RepID=UPI0029BE4198|nr:nuclear transport factor 2 family protein [Streptomyces europaeiscabiei]MDX3695476.1 nuclear transport factor 2 family protein [Streptomyces europaeiscabiei]
MSTTSTTSKPSRRALVAAVVTAAVAVVTTAPAAVAAPRTHCPKPTAGHEKSVAVQVLKGVFERGDTKVVDRYVRPDYIQHNPTAPDGSAALKTLATTVHQQFPDARYDVKRVIAEGDLVLVHSNAVMTPGTRGTAVFDIFRFQKGKIAEHWDAEQDVPETTVSGHDMFATLSAPRTDAPVPHADTAANKRVVTKFFDEVLVGHNVAAADKYVSAKTYYQHSPGFGDGLKDFKAGFEAYFSQFPNAVTLPKRVIAEGDLVAVHNNDKTSPDDRGNAVVDLFRVRNGKIVEHWDVTQAVPATSANDNTMF